MVDKKKEEENSEGSQEEKEAPKPSKESKDAGEEMEKEKKKGKKEDVAVVLSDRADRGYRLSGSTYKVKTPQGKAYVTINKDEDNKPIEVFLNVGKAGSDVAALSIYLTRIS
mgnify:CR=1 FL=1